MIYLDYVKFCAEECDRQQSGELSVYRMVEAYEDAVRCYSSNTKHIQPWLIKKLGATIEPEKAKGYRKIPVTINSVSIPTFTIEKNIESICTLQPEEYSPETAIDFYRYFENIHPFEDGNGRVGAILFNWVNGTLYHPVTPPNLF